LPEMPNAKGPPAPIWRSRCVGKMRLQIQKLITNFCFAWMFMSTKTRPGDTVLIEPRVTLVVDNQVAPVIDDRRDRSASRGDRRIASRLRTLKGAQIVWPTAAPVKCVVRNLSRTGAALEVHGPVPGAFELVFDGDQSRRLCHVVWRGETRIGVKFQ
jgi:hypothetical protein